MRLPVGHVSADFLRPGSDRVAFGEFDPENGL